MPGLVILIVMVAPPRSVFLNVRRRSSELFLATKRFALNWQPLPLHATSTVAPGGSARRASFLTRVFPRLTTHFAITRAPTAATAVGCLGVWPCASPLGDPPLPGDAGSDGEPLAGAAGSIDHVAVRV